MSSDGSVELEWADGLYKFKLGLGEIRQLEEKLDEGIFRICRRLELANANREFWLAAGLRADHVFESIRLALIGGKQVEPTQALKLCNRYVAPYLWSSIPLAFAIVSAGIEQVPGDPVGKAPAAKDGSESPATGTDDSPSPPSTAPAPS